MNEKDFRDIVNRLEKLENEVFKQRKSVVKAKLEQKVPGLAPSHCPDCHKKLFKRSGTMYCMECDKECA